MKKILVFARVPMNLICIHRIYERLKDTYSFFGFSTDDEEVFEKVGWKIKKTGSLMAKYRKWDMYLSSDIYLASKRARVKIHTFHGISFKGRAYTPKVLEYDKLFIIGEYMRRRFIELGILKEKDSRILKVGMPKLDPLVDGSFTQEKAKEYLGINPHDIVALYAPTWGKASSLELYADMVVKITKKQGIKLIMKLHDHSLKEKKWQNKIKVWEKEGAIIYKNFDITPAMAAADILISDFSSVANEFLLLNRPIIYLYVPSFTERYGETADVKMMFKAGVCIEKPEYKLLEETVKRSLDFPDEFSSERKKLAKFLFYNPGKATDVAVKYIKELLN